MRFLYEYRTHNNERRSGTINATDREAVFAILKAEGIRPSIVREAPGICNRLFGKGKRWMLIGVLLVVVAVLAFILYRQIENANAIESSGMFAIRSQIYGDAWVLKTISADRWVSVFSSEGDRFLACHAIPGRDCGCSLMAADVRAKVVRTLSTEVDNLCEISDDDLSEVAEIKRMVNWMKGELKAYLNAGGTAEKYASRLDIRQAAEIGILKRSQDELRNATDERLWRMTNLKLRNMGLPMIQPLE